MANYHSTFEEFFFFDEDEVDEIINESDLPDVVTLVQAGITAGVLNRSPTELELSDADADGAEEEEAIEVPIIPSDTAIHDMGELACFLQAMKDSEIRTPTGKKLQVPTLVKRTVQLRIALLQ